MRAEGRWEGRDAQPEVAPKGRVERGGQSSAAARRGPAEPDSEVRRQASALGGLALVGVLGAEAQRWLTAQSSAEAPRTLLAWGSEVGEPEVDVADRVDRSWEGDEALRTPRPASRQNMASSVPLGSWTSATDRAMWESAVALAMGRLANRAHMTTSVAYAPPRRIGAPRAGGETLAA